MKYRVETNPFSKDRYTPEQLEMFKNRQLSKDKAEAYFTRLYNQHIARVIIANVMAEYTTTFRKSATSFEEAWEALDYQRTTEIVFRAVNGLPCSEKDTGELETYFITGQSLQKIFWLYGEGGTGKGTFQQLLINLIGMENVASLKITGLSNSRFSTSILLGKSLVIGDDVQKDAVIKDTSDMFSLATGDIMTIEDKGKRPYSIRLNMTVVQSSNGLPRMNGDKSAIDRRFRILIFSSRFKDKPNPAIKKDYINRKEVLEYLVKLAIETPSEDINPKQSQTLLGEHQKDINPVLDFVEKTFREDLASEFIPNDFIWYCWKQYQDYFNQSFFKTERGLHRDIKQVLPPYIRTGVRTIPSGQQLHKGFYPKEDTPDYASLATYSNGRETPEKRKRPKQDRGYWNSKAKHK